MIAPSTPPARDADAPAEDAVRRERPRDRTGRPLPHDTDVVLRTEEHTYATVDEALAVGVRLWREQRYFEAHECLEDVWHTAPDEDRAFWKGVIQVAVGCVHHQRRNADGCVTLLRRALSYLDGYPSPHHGVDTDRLRALAEDLAAVTEAAGACVGDAALPFPSTADGPHVGPSPTDGPYPLRDEPAWASRPRGEVDRS